MSVLDHPAAAAAAAAGSHKTDTYVI